MYLLPTFAENLIVSQQVSLQGGKPSRAGILYSVKVMVTLF